MVKTLDISGELEKSGWDRPLSVSWDWHLKLLRQEIQGNAPYAGGDLRRAFDDKDTVTINKQQTEIRITVDETHQAWQYAKIQDEGGYVPPFDLKKAVRNPMMRRTPYKKAMVAMIGGTLRFFTKRKGFHLPGFQYVEKGVIAWINKLSRGSADVTVVTWQGGTAGETFGPTRGIMG